MIHLIAALLLIQYIMKLTPFPFYLCSVQVMRRTAFRGRISIHRSRVLFGDV